MANKLCWPSTSAYSSSCCVWLVEQMDDLVRYAEKHCPCKSVAAPSATKGTVDMDGDEDIVESAETQASASNEGAVLQLAKPFVCGEAKKPHTRCRQKHFGWLG